MASGWAYVGCADFATGSGPTGSVQFHTEGTSISGSQHFMFYTGSVYHGAANTLVLSGNMVITGSLSASVIKYENITVIDSTGSTFFGNTNDDVHARTGSLRASTLSTPVFWATASADGATPYVGIGTIGALATLQVQGGSAAAVPTLLVDHDDDNVVGVDINLANTTAIGIDIDAGNTTTAVLDIAANALTTGKGVNVTSTSNSLNTANLLYANASGTSTNAYSVAKIVKDAANLSDSNAIVGLDIDFDGTAGTAGRALRIDSEQTTGIVAEIDGNALTTGAALDISTAALTTGYALHVGDNSANTSTRNSVEIAQEEGAAIGATALNVSSHGGITGIALDKNFSDTTAATVTGLSVDLDKTGTSTSNNTIYGINVDVDNTTATNGNNTMIGIHVTPKLYHAAHAGTPTVKGAVIWASGSVVGTSTSTGMELTSAGADTNNGLIINCADGGTDFKAVSSADTGDFFSITTTTHGATTLATVDDDSNDDADLTLDADGKIVVEAKAGDEVVFNEGGLDVDFRVESVDETHMIFVEGSSNRVGVGLAAPSALLHVSSSGDGVYYQVEGATQSGSASPSPAALLFVTGSGPGSAQNTAALSGGVGIGTSTPTQVLEVFPDKDVAAIIGRARVGYNGYVDAATFGHLDRPSPEWALWQNSAGTTILNTATAGTGLYFRVNNSDKMKLTTDGKLGIGTATPISALEIEDGLTTVGAVLTLGTKEPTVVADDVLGRINFYAPLDTGLDSDEIGASIAAIAQATFSDTVNSTALHFQTGKSEVATTKMVIDEDGRVGIGTSAPAAALHVDNDDTDLMAFHIDAANIDADVVNIEVAALTTGKALYIDHNDTATTAVTPTTMHVDFDKSGVVADGVTSTWTALDLDMSDAATNHANANVTMTGLDIDVDSASTQGTNTNVGVDIVVTDATTNDGIRIVAENGAGVDLKMISSADAEDYCTIAVGAAGETTITTVDHAAAAADLNFVVDGDIILGPGGGDVLPDADNSRNLGSGLKRWANVYTADLHLANDRGDWTVIEEENYLTIRSNKTGKRFKLLMEEIED